MIRFFRELALWLGNADALVEENEALREAVKYAEAQVRTMREERDQWRRRYYERDRGEPISRGGIDAET